MRILLSTSYATGFPVCGGRRGEHEVDVVKRGSDWGLSGWRKAAYFAREAAHLARLSRHYDAVALLTSGVETSLLGAWLKATRNPVRLVCADFLIPHMSALQERLGWALRRVDAFVCIRSGDRETLARRFAIARQRCSFAPFPCAPAAAAIPAEDHGYIYSAGWAHRDWTTLCRALERTPFRAILSAGGDPPEVDSERIRILPQQSPEEGRRLMANAALVALPLAETELPSGPIVLLDAMAMGKALIVTGVNGSRDYIKHGTTGWIVPPGDASAMARAISYLMNRPGLRRRLGCEARRKALACFTPERFIHAVLDACIGSPSVTRPT